MAIYNYKAINSQNHIITGTVTASSSDEVKNTLTKDSLRLISIREEVKYNASNSQIPAIEKITFCRYVSTMLAAGLSLGEGMVTLRDETKQPVMRQILTDVLYHLERGDQMSKALALYPKSFNKFFIALVRAGEVSGTLAESFKYLEEWLRSEYSLTQKIKGALVYPAVIISAMFGIGSLMIFFVMPQIAKVFLTMTIPIPPITRTIFQLSLTISSYRIPIIIGMVLSAVSIGVFVSKPSGKKLLLTAIQPVPVIKVLLQQIDIARFCRIFSTLIASAVPVTESLEISLNSLANPKFKANARIVVDEVMEGQKIAQSLKAHELFPPLLIQMIAGGEKSGTLDTTLKDLASFYEEEVADSVKKSTELLEPLLMLIVGIGVGGMILSIIAPMYSVVGSFNGAR